MQLSVLLRDIATIPSSVDGDIVSVVLNSQKVLPGALFIATQGVHVDGRQYIADAIARGAKAILVEGELEDESITIEQSTPIIPIYHLKTCLGEIAARFYHYPAKKLRMIGVTGTNGKTSCTNFIAQALKGSCAMIGTLGSGFPGALLNPGLTTPDIISLQTLLSQFLEEGAQTVAMEVSSHGIDQGRINGVDFEIGVFTNLTQDHLDYHGTMGAYAKVKRRFLASDNVKRVIINADDDYGRAWLDELKQDKSVFGYSTKVTASNSYPLIHASNAHLTLEGMRATVHTPWGDGELSLPLIGEFNLSNALAVLTTLCVFGLPLERVLERLSTLTPVPGRMQALGGKGRPLVVVDYSHTPDALEKALSALRLHTEGHLICVFGCGGDRDASKRPLMAKIAERLADKVIVTNDNPRHEQPEAIVEQIKVGFVKPESVLVLLDRSKAIENSIQLAKYNDCILIAGKGAEQYQQMGDEKIPFDDVAEAEAYLERY